MGIGTAVDVRIGLNIKLCKSPKFLNHTMLSVGENFYVGLYVDFNFSNVFGKYELVMYYQDMYQNKYKQSYNFIFKKGDEKNRITLISKNKQERYEKVAEDEGN